MKKLAIVTTHPIQYNAPMFRMLQQRNEISIRVFYTWGKAVLENKYDPGFNEIIDWDIPLLEGYSYAFVNNIAKNSGSHHFTGIDDPTLIKELEEYNADSILVYGWCFKSHLKVLRHFKGKKSISFRGDSTLLNEGKGFSFRKIIRNLFLKWIYSHVNHAFYVGSANKGYYLKFGLKENQLIFAPHAIDNDRFTNQTTANFRAQLHISMSDIVFVFAGKFEAEKNPVFLLEGFIRASLENVHLVLVGSGHLKKALKLKVEEQPLSLQGHIHFVDFQNQSKMPAIYQTGDVFILPSQSETWGLSVNEAMASGKAVLVSNKCGCYLDLVQDGINGFVFTSNDIGDLANKMKKIAENKNIIHEMGKASQEIIKKWSYSNVCLAIEKAMQEV